MTNIELSELIAVRVLGWEKIDDRMYKNSEGFYILLTNWAESIAHALDLAALNGVGIMPVESGWQAFLVESLANLAIDPSPAKAIALAILIVHNIES
jgi:hypothetical protein